MRQRKLSQAITMAIAGTALTFAAAGSASASTTMYNTFGAGTATPGGTTDGWQCSDGGDSQCGAGSSLVPWVGTSGSSPSLVRPFGMPDVNTDTAENGGATAVSATNWAAHITAAGDSLEISRADAVARYGVEADIDSAGGAWQDASSNHHGWAHNTDIGLFKSDVNAMVTLKATNLTFANAQFGVTVFTGMDADIPGSSYTHHTNWNIAKLSNYDNSDPFGTTGVNYAPDALGNVMWTSNIGEGFTFMATAGQVYSIYLGGSQGTGWNQQHAQYTLEITTSAVPLPGAVWLFGSALVGLGAAGRRKLKQ
ncbi:VPLPA-CTERM sorting domain-containing protein [Methylomonas sp. LL1]|uniref:VPLPA-CTERM sorting domain-containing protein n=1 Tax=Methylomonas sp. LL1 TaxID=2785785 RepID=UPI0018C35FD6|nr:VPLPA-CTERM sorting domain-containing protein [Methylomonas sp. LL1]QPK63976.1 VPLPA-CTERM sorting domain-containing protein [Methylomonas sp. LL1]